MNQINSSFILHPSSFRETADEYTIRLATSPRLLRHAAGPLVLEPSQGQLSGDAGLLPIRPFDQRIRFTRAFADALDDRGDPELTEHTFLKMVRSRVCGILGGYGKSGK